MSCKMKICHVITRMIVGGAQENTLFTVTDHIAKGHEVVLVTGPSPGREGELLAYSQKGNFEIIVVPELVRELSPLTDLKAYKKLKQLFIDRKFDVVHTHSSKAGIIGRVAAWDANVPCVVHTVHGHAFHPYEKWFKRKIYIASEKFAAKRCHKIFAVAQAMIDQCVDVGIAPKEKFQVVYSGMEISRFLEAKPETELRESLNIPKDAQVISTLARLFPMKGYEYVIPAAITLAKELKNLHFLIIGDGPMYDDLQKELAKHGLTERFHFAGLISPSQVHRYLALSNLLWHLSLHEGLPRSVVQALACGKPAIGFELDGTPEVVISGKSGFCVPPEDIDAVVDFSRQILASPDFTEELGKNGQKIVAEKFDHKFMTNILEKEYKNLLKGETL